MGQQPEPKSPTRRDSGKKFVIELLSRLSEEAKATGAPPPNFPEAVAWIQQHQWETPFAGIAPNRIAKTVSQDVFGMSHYSREAARRQRKERMTRALQETPEILTDERWQAVALNQNGNCFDCKEKKPLTNVPIARGLFIRCRTSIASVVRATCGNVTESMSKAFARRTLTRAYALKRASRLKS